MATTLRLDEDLAATVERARQLAAATGELLARDAPPFRSPIPPQVGAAVGELLRDGTYADAVARVAAHDPDLADQ